MRRLRTDSGKSEDAGGWWVFGFGSLMWDPGFEFAEQRAGLVHGWHRRFTLISNESWGSRERPGLCAALHPGGSVYGRAFRVAGAHAEPVRRTLERRENAYRHVTVSARLDDGRRIAALSFVYNPDCPRFAPDLDVATQCALIRQGVGAKGTSLEYLENVIARLRDDGATPRRCMRLLRAVRENGAGAKPDGSG